MRCTLQLKKCIGNCALVLHMKCTKGVCLGSDLYSCIEIYAHSCLKPFLIGRKPCSNSKTHVQIMKFTCRLNMGFGRRHWSMRRDVMCFVLNKMADVKETPRFSVSFYVVNVIFKRF